MNGFKTKLIQQKSLGEKLRINRRKKELTLDQAEDATKVRRRYLEAFEKDDFDSLPDEVYAVGFLRRYLEFLNLPTDKFLLEFKRARAAWQTMNQHHLTPKQSVQEPKVLITPKFVFGSLATIVVFAMTSYIWLQVRHLTAPPELTIITPSQSAKVAIEQIEITGRTDPGAVVAINSEIINQDKEGNFKETVALQSGVNTIQIIATNRFNKQNNQTITVLRTGQQQPQPQATPSQS